MIYIVVSVLIFIATIALYAALVLRRREKSTQLLRERIGVPPQPEEAWVPLQVQRDERLSAIPLMDRVLRGLSIARRLELLLFLFVTYKKSIRQRQFAEEFPDALDLLVSALRAGISFSAALQIVADESPEPIRSEFAIVVEEQALGVDLRDALSNMANRVDSLDLKFFVTAVVLQRAAGGNLTEVLDNTGKLIRDRFRILGDIKTFTSAGRLTGVVLSALPAGMCVFMIMVAPDYFHKMWDHPMGRTILGLAFFLQLLGWLTIRKIVNIKV